MYCIARLGCIGCIGRAAAYRVLDVVLNIRVHLRRAHGNVYKAPRYVGAYAIK